MSACSSPPRLDVAPTHHLVKLEERSVKDYLNPSNRAQIPEGELSSQWYSEVGLRFFPPFLISALAAREVEGEHYLPEYIREVMATGCRVLGYLTASSWKHFAVPADLECKEPLLLT